MSDFYKAWVITEKNEGGYSNHPDDSGGETNGGISKKEYPNLDIKNLTTDQIAEIAKRDYWDRYRVGEIVDQDMAAYIFDMLYNMNPILAIKCVQTAYNQISNQNITIDGIIGSGTIYSINSIVKNPQFLDKLRLQRISQYTKIVQVNNAQIVNLIGWIRRSLL